MRRIAALVVNHNTSLFAELALRSLVLAHACPPADLDLEVTVLDNHSSDDGLAGLERAVEETGAHLLRSRWPLYATTLNTHGDALRDFVLSRRDPTFYLFVDADIVVLDEGVVWRMARELDEAQNAWANQARYAHGGDLDVDAGVSQRISIQIDDWPVLGFTAGYGRRCHPAFTLVRNTASFLRAAERVGLGAGLVLSQDTEVGGFYDTLGLASLAMGVCGFRYLLSTTSVLHFGNMSYEPSDSKTAEAERMLVSLRQGRTGR